MNFIFNILFVVSLILSHILLFLWQREKKRFEKCHFWYKVTRERLRQIRIDLLTSIAQATLDQEEEDLFVKQFDCHGEQVVMRNWMERMKILDSSQPCYDNDKDTGKKSEKEASHGSL